MEEAKRKVPAGEALQGRGLIPASGCKVPGDLALEGKYQGKLTRKLRCEAWKQRLD